MKRHVKLGGKLGPVDGLFQPFVTILRRSRLHPFDQPL